MDMFRRMVSDILIVITIVLGLFWYISIFLSGLLMLVILPFLLVIHILLGVVEGWICSLLFMGRNWRVRMFFDIKRWYFWYLKVFGIGRILSIAIFIRLAIDACTGVYIVDRWRNALALLFKGKNVWLIIQPWIKFHHDFTELYSVFYALSYLAFILTHEKIHTF